MGSKSLGEREQWGGNEKHSEAAGGGEGKKKEKKKKKKNHVWYIRCTGLCSVLNFWCLTLGTG